LLIGEAADSETIKNIRRLAESDTCVQGVNNILTMHFGPNSIMLALELRLPSSLSAEEVKQTVDRVERAIRERYPDVKHVFIEFDSGPAKPLLRAAT
jgi:divalent metal cation (Fe/Co/Zn/Cd) transporter